MSSESSRKQYMVDTFHQYFSEYMYWFIANTRGSFREEYCEAHYQTCDIEGDFAKLLNFGGPIHNPKCAVLHHVIEFGNVGLVKLILERLDSTCINSKSEPGILDQAGFTPLMIAVASTDMSFVCETGPHDRLKIVRMLLDRGARTDIKDDSHQETALQRAYRMKEWCENDAEEDVVEKIIKELHEVRFTENKNKNCSGERGCAMNAIYRDLRNTNKMSSGPIGLIFKFATG